MSHKDKCRHTVSFSSCECYHAGSGLVPHPGDKYDSKRMRKCPCAHGQPRANSLSPQNWLDLTFSISPLFLLRAERVILTVTAFSSPWRRRAMRLGCRELKEISSSGWGKRLVLPFSVEISEASSTDGQPAEPYLLHLVLRLFLLSQSETHVVQYPLLGFKVYKATGGERVEVYTQNAIINQTDTRATYHNKGSRLRLFTRSESCLAFSFSLGE
ncbi:hypothetical protein EYF80_042469 [Liparis tanakae]|uniref:Uncharacterized protein n=1 Tax=Liparis tanakae TaxID=230148 RepID=A0A4Z2G472_9TELE|nr:hypothetical protein EYF80_042469 [Liparis tanakae]